MIFKKCYATILLGCKYVQAVNEALILDKFYASQVNRLTLSLELNQSDASRVALHNCDRKNFIPVLLCFLVPNDIVLKLPMQTSQEYYDSDLDHYVYSHKIDVPISAQIRLHSATPLVMCGEELFFGKNPEKYQTIWEGGGYTFAKKVISVLQAYQNRYFGFFRNHTTESAALIKKISAGEDWQLIIAEIREFINKQNPTTFNNGDFSAALYVILKNLPAEDVCKVEFDNVMRNRR